MKIGLLSYHKNYNYGWNLQCYALMTVLKSMGHDVTLIDKRKFSRAGFTIRIKTIFKSIIHKIIGKQESVSYEEEQRRKGLLVEVFFAKHLKPRTKVIGRKSDYKDLPHFDALVVGSDQVWRSKLVAPIEDYYFAFVDYSARFISYAASFGVDFEEFSKEDAKRCGDLIKKFQAVSVREQSGIHLIKDVYKWNCDPVVMPDPTLLMVKKDYERLIGDTACGKGGLFCYVLDKAPDKERAIERIAVEYSLKTNLWCLSDIKDTLFPSVEEWLSAFRDSDYIFTDSFHGCVFSIIFRKPFIAYGNASRGLARFVSLLDSFSLRDRLIYSSMDLDQLDLRALRNLDAGKLDKLQEEIRQKGVRFLETSLS